MKTISELLGELIQVAYKCTRHDVFVEYMPHVHGIYVKVFLGKWKKRTNEKSCYQYTVYLNQDGAEIKLKAIISHIKALGGNYANN